MAKQLFEWDYSSYPGASTYPHLFKPIRIGNLIVPNRIKYAATEDNLNGRDGFVTDAGVAYMRERAKGVVGGLCFMQGVYMDEKRQGQGYVGQAACWDDKFVPGLKRIADAIHEEKAVAGFQLMDCGRVGAVDVEYGHGPSAVPQRLRIFRPVKEMSKDEIKEMIQQHVDAARRGIEAGFDIMEISGIVGYLVSNFISRYTNRRTDEYGGDIRGRMRAVVEIIQGVKAVCGSDVPLGIRLCAEELLDDVRGNTPDESMETYKIAEEAGVDYISVTLGWQESIYPVISRDIPMGNWIHLAKRAKEHVKVPVQMAYRLFRPDLPNKAIGAGELDQWEMCRSMIADPLMPKKVLEGKEDEIRHCVACNLCLARLFRDAPMTCYINPVCAHETNPEFADPQPAEDKKEIMIVGAGPAGLECAYMAAKRGHEVHVYDKRDNIGGTLNEARKAPYGDDELWTCVAYQQKMCELAGVTFHLGTEVTEDLISDELPDAVVLATGPEYPEFPGGPHANVVNLLDVMRENAQVGEKVVIWGNRKPGIGCALYLAKQGKKVTLVGREKTAGFDVNPSFKWRYMIYLRQNGVKAYNDCEIETITGEGIIIRTFDGYRIPVACDTIVNSDRAANEALKKVVQSEGIELFVIGDALVPRNLSSAVHDGYRIGMRI
ncbi:MAG: FAD-dependent oxidoreductase [Deltaproteobacteria bacterium]|nr:FAD-dependent oxidoreductase [Deltaproteobacteria bacterium]MBW2040849.1 FAD-dependent oxidoreductase [Deltaproteobacteria bacterium]MBW2132075.1 FAD-dependent oxidoreductase [Deltaproteobacteria bacterium]